MTIIYYEKELVWLVSDLVHEILHHIRIDCFTIRRLRGLDAIHLIHPNGWIDDLERANQIPKELAGVIITAVEG